MSRRWAWLLLALVFAALFFRYHLRAEKRQAADFRVTYAAAQTFLERGDLYAKFEDPTIATYKYSPFFAMLAAPLALLTLHQAALAFFALNFLFLVVMFVYARRLIAGEDGPADWRLWALPLLFTGRLFLKVMDAGQVNIVMVGLVVLSLYAMQKRREGLSAALLMLGVMIKYTPVIFVPYFLARKKWRFTLYSAAFAALYCVLPMAWVGFEKGLAYLTGWMPYVVKTSLDIGSLADFRNQSLCAALLRYFSSGQYFVDRIRFSCPAGAVSMSASAARSTPRCSWPAWRFSTPIPGRSTTWRCSSLT
jgi:alpha-1,2-mannosyltransferase